MYNNWRERLIKIIAHIEAYIDFAEDQNIEDDTLSAIQASLAKIIEDIEQFLNDGNRGQMRRDGVKTVILGEPNVGKSSFMNHICRKPISIVANVPGTTRDIIESSFNIGGYPVLLADTAGLRCHTDDPIEKEGILRATNYAKNVDLLILMMDAMALRSHQFNIEEYKKIYFKQLGIDADDWITEKSCLIIVNKIDLLRREEIEVFRRQLNQEKISIRLVSCKNNIGIDEATKEIQNNLVSL